MQGKLQGRLLDFSIPQPIDECLSILGDSMVRHEEVTAVMGVYAKAVKDGEVNTLTSQLCKCPNYSDSSQPWPGHRCLC